MMIVHYVTAAAEGQSVRAFASHAGSWEFESKPQGSLVVKTSTDSPIAKRPVSGVSVTGLWR